jgi:hypothetical protein
MPSLMVTSSALDKLPKLRARLKNLAYLFATRDVLRLSAALASLTERAQEKELLNVKKNIP